MTRRFYDPTTGRFVNRDPIGYAGVMNVYGYAGNNPITGSDTSGEVAYRWAHEPFAYQTGNCHGFLMIVNGLILVPKTAR